MKCSREMQIGAEARIVSVSGSLSGNRIQFECPSAPSGTPIRVQVQRGGFWSNVLEDTLTDAAPGILPFDGTREVAPGAPLTLFAIGLSQEALDANAQVRVVVGGVPIPAQAASSGIAGIWRVTAQMPVTGMRLNRELPAFLEVRLADGRVFESNIVHVLVPSKE